MTIFIFSRFFRTASSTLVLPVLSISFINDNGSNAAKGMSFLISSATFIGSLSAYGAVIKKSILSDNEPTVLLVGLEGFLAPSLHNTSGYDCILFSIDTNATCVAH